MKFSILLLFASVFTLTSFSQSKHDIGIKLSSLEREGLQLEYRNHLNSEYSLIVSLNAGQELDGYLFQGETPDSVVTNQYLSNTRNTFYSGKIGVKRNLSFLPTNFFYAGVLLGIGYEEFTTENSHDLIYFDEDGTSIHIPTGLRVTYSNSSENTFNSGLFYQLDASIGMDIPISKRFLINCQLNGALFCTKSVNTSSGGFLFSPSFSGGLRYSFGLK